MKTICNKSDNDELIRRISSVNATNVPLWGKMNVYQMLKHCRLWEEMIAGEKKYKQGLIGILFGKMALKNMLRDDSVLGKNMPTIPDFKIKEANGDIETEKTKWINKIIGNGEGIKPDFVHPFFGKMTNEQIGYLAYKHTDHHLRQFNA